METLKMRLLDLRKNDYQCPCYFPNKQKVETIYLCISRYFNKWHGLLSHKTFVKSNKHFQENVYSIIILLSYAQTTLDHIYSSSIFHLINDICDDKFFGIIENW